jgi:Dullard-like phosphatase family protein
MRAETNPGNSNTSITQTIITQNYFSKKEDGECDILEKEIVINPEQIGSKKSDPEINSKIGSQPKIKNFKEDQKNSDKDVKSYRSKNSSKKSGRSLKERIKHFSSKKTVQNGNNVEDIKNFHEYTKECMKYIDKIEFDNNEELESLKFDLDEKFINMIKSKEKGLAIFDLDETLIHREIEDYKDCDKILDISLPDIEHNQIGIYVRPMVLETLKRISTKYILVLFTASQQEYADKVIELIDPNNELFIKRLYRDSCRQVTLDDCVFYVKDLEIFRNVPMERVVIIDNSIISFCKQLDNGIPILPYYNNKYDTELKDLVGYLEYLYHTEDFRLENKNIFALKYYYQNDDSSDSECKSSSSNSSSGDELIAIDFQPPREESQHKFLFNSKSNTSCNFESSILCRANTFCSIYSSNSEYSDLAEFSDNAKESKNGDINRSKALFKYMDVFQSKSKK